MNKKTYTRTFIAILFVLGPDWKTQMVTKSDLIFSLQDGIATMNIIGK